MMITSVENFSLNRIADEMQMICLYGELRLQVKQRNEGTDIEFIDTNLIRLEDNSNYKSDIKLAVLHLNKENQVKTINHIFTELTPDTFSKIKKLYSLLGKKIQL